MAIERIAILASSDPNDISTFSGVPYNMMTEFRKYFDVVEGFFPPPILAHDYRQKIRRHLTGKVRLIGHNAPETKFRAAMVSRKINAFRPDAIFAITIDNICAYLQVDAPVIHHSDATFRGMENYYSDFTNLNPTDTAFYDDTTRECIQKAALSIFPSSWAADSAIEDYAASPDKIFVVPYGSNLNPSPSREEAFRERYYDKCRLLMIGGDWERKGGPILVKVVEELDARGIPCELNVVGRCPVSHPLVKPFGFLNKNVPEELEQYRKLWTEAHFFALLTQAETFGAVFAEAAAWGVPAIATHTGGVPDAVADGKSGRLLPVDAQPKQFADAIEKLWEDRNEYKEMASNARDRYEGVLNWPAWGKSVAEIIKSSL